MRGSLCVAAAWRAPRPSGKGSATAWTPGAVDVRMAWGGAGAALWAGARGREVGGRGI